MGDGLFSSSTAVYSIRCEALRLRRPDGRLLLFLLFSLFLFFLLCLFRRETTPTRPQPRSRSPSRVLFPRRSA